MHTSLKYFFLVFFIIMLSISLYFFALPIYQKNIDRQTDALTARLKIATSTPIIEEKTVAFSDSYTTGFESDLRKVTYTITYADALFKVRSLGSKIFLYDIVSKKISTISIIYNGALGIGSVTEYWNTFKPCPSCQRVTPTIGASDVSDIAVFDGPDIEYIVYAKDPGFVVMELQHPTDDMRRTVESLDIKTEPAKILPEQMAISLYYMAEATSTKQNPCTTTIAIQRSIDKTNTPATVALTELFHGPKGVEVDANKDLRAVYTSLWLNSLFIEKGKAIVDITKESVINLNQCQKDGLKEEITKTLLQFSTITSVDILGDGKAL